MPKTIDNPIICLNCGTECYDKFCPHCGQSTSTPKKLKMKNFWKGLMMSFGRLNPGFITTAKGLILHPWDVIRDHIHGKTVRFSPPFTMLIQVWLYGIILYSVIDAIFGTQLIANNVLEESWFEYEGSNPILRLIDSSVVLSTLIFGIPVCFIIYIAYLRHGARKYNFAEYLVGFVYMFISITIYDMILNLTMAIPNFPFDMFPVTMCIAISFSVTLLIKAFPQNKWWKHPILFLWTIFLIFLSIIIVANILNILGLLKI